MRAMWRRRLENSFFRRRIPEVIPGFGKGYASFPRLSAIRNDAVDNTLFLDNACLLVLGKEFLFSDK